MQSHSLHVPLAGPAKTKWIPRGQEKFAFLYGVAAAITLTCVIAYSLMANLAWWQGLLLTIACLLAVGTAVFSVLEMYRNAKAGKGIAAASEALAEEPDPYSSRKVVMGPPSGEPYPHHEHHIESPGLDQGQLTARVPGSTPFVDKLFGQRDQDK